MVPTLGVSGVGIPCTVIPVVPTLGVSGVGIPCTVITVVPTLGASGAGITCFGILHPLIPGASAPLLPGTAVSAADGPTRLRGSLRPTGTISRIQNRILLGTGGLVLLRVKECLPLPARLNHGNGKRLIPVADDITAGISHLEVFAVGTSAPAEVAPAAGAHLLRCGLCGSKNMNGSRRTVHLHADSCRNGIQQRRRGTPLRLPAQENKVDAQPLCAFDYLQDFILNRIAPHRVSPGDNLQQFIEILYHCEQMGQRATAPGPALAVMLRNRAASALVELQLPVGDVRSQVVQIAPELSLRLHPASGSLVQKHLCVGKTPQRAGNSHAPKIHQLQLKLLNRETHTQRQQIGCHRRRLTAFPFSGNHQMGAVRRIAQIQIHRPLRALADADRQILRIGIGPVPADQSAELLPQILRQAFAIRIANLVHHIAQGPLAVRQTQEPEQLHMAGNHRPCVLPIVECAQGLERLVMGIPLPVFAGISAVRGEVVHLEGIPLVGAAPLLLVHPPQGREQIPLLGPAGPDQAGAGPGKLMHAVQAQQHRSSGFAAPVQKLPHRMVRQAVILLRHDQDMGQLFSLPGPFFQNFSHPVQKLPGLPLSEGKGRPVRQQPSEMGQMLVSGDLVLALIPVLHLPAEHDQLNILRVVVKAQIQQHIGQKRSMLHPLGHHQAHRGILLQVHQHRRMLQMGKPLGNGSGKLRKLPALRRPFFSVGHHQLKGRTAAGTQVPVTEAREPVPGDASRHRKNRGHQHASGLRDAQADLQEIRISLAPAVNVSADPEGLADQGLIRCAVGGWICFVQFQNILLLAAANLFQHLPDIVLIGTAPPFQCSIVGPPLQPAVHHTRQGCGGDHRAGQKAQMLRLQSRSHAVKGRQYGARGNQRRQHNGSQRWGICLRRSRGRKHTKLPAVKIRNLSLAQIIRRKCLLLPGTQVPFVKQHRRLMPQNRVKNQSAGIAEAKLLQRQATMALLLQPQQGQKRALQLQIVFGAVEIDTAPGNHGMTAELLRQQLLGIGRAVRAGIALAVCVKALQIHLPADQPAQALPLGGRGGQILGTHGGIAFIHP